MPINPCTLNKARRSRPGFSLIEVMVAVAIIGMIATISVSSLRGVRRDSDLARAANRLASDIKLMQSHSLGLATFEGNYPKYGWGLDFVDGDDSYVLFADEPDTPPSGNAYEYDDPGEKWKTVQLPEDIEIDALKVDASDVSPVDVVFDPPEPVVYLDTSSSSAKFEIILVDTRSHKTATVTINRWGMVE